MSTTQRESKDRLAPDYDKLSTAYAILSEELPRLSNLDANGIVRALEALQAEVKSNPQTIMTHLDVELLKVRESLDLLNRRLDGLESLATRIPVSDLQAINHSISDGITSSYPIPIPAVKEMYVKRFFCLSTFPPTSPKF